MRPELKEDPNEWRKFALAFACFASVFCLAFWRRGKMANGSFRGAMACIALLLLIGLCRPRAIRPVYRGMMTVSSYIGQVMGRVLLAIFFLLILTPLGIFLRLTGKDLLRLKRGSHSETYWKTARKSEDLTRQF